MSGLAIYITQLVFIVLMVINIAVLVKRDIGNGI